MTLSVLATPIGNLKDITLRAKEVLEQATLIVAEDTRTTGQLMKLLGISSEGKIFRSSHAQSSQVSFKKLLNECAEHEHIALVTDAGTPAISDPGSLFVDMFRKTYPQGEIVPIPGPSALAAALSVSGFPASHFLFLGFLPHKKGRQTLFKMIAETDRAVVCYESPHRIMKTLEILAESIGDRPLMVGREMTKQFEEYPRGSAAFLLDYFKKNPEKIRGEFVIVIAPRHSFHDIMVS